MTDLRVDAVLFDKDGTLFDFATTWEAWAKAFLGQLSGGDTLKAQDMGAAIGFDMQSGRFHADSIVIAGNPAEVGTCLLPFLPHYDLDGLLDVLNTAASEAPQVEAVPLELFLQGLRDSGLKLGVATNDAEAPARVHLKKAGVEDAFDFIAGFDSGHGAKPEAGQLLAFARHTGVNPARVVMVGDSTHDLHAGRAAGMQTVGVLTGMAPREVLEPHADAVLDSIADLPDWIATS